MTAKFGKEIASGELAKRLLHARFRLSREERDYVAGHALDSIQKSANVLVAYVAGPENYPRDASDEARKIAALSNLLGDIGWEREGIWKNRFKGREAPGTEGDHANWFLGELFPAAQLRPWLEQWVKKDTDILVAAEKVLEFAQPGDNPCEEEPSARIGISDAQAKLGTGALFLARLEKWMASHEN